jgi:hypothetical protein
MYGRGVVLSIALGAGCRCMLLDEMTCCNDHPWKDDPSDGKDDSKGGFPPSHAVL